MIREDSVGGRSCLSGAPAEDAPLQPAGAARTLYCTWYGQLYHTLFLLRATVPYTVHGTGSCTLNSEVDCTVPYTVQSTSLYVTQYSSCTVCYTVQWLHWTLHCVSRSEKERRAGLPPPALARDGGELHSAHQWLYRIKS